MNRILFRILVVAILASGTLFLLYPILSTELSSGEYSFSSNLSSANVSQIVFTGDVMLAREVAYLQSKYGYDYPFLGYSLQKPNAVVLGNFEAALSNSSEMTLDRGMHFEVASTSAEVLEEAGFTHLSLANNHSLDAGAGALDNSYSTFKNARIVAFGHPNKIDEGSVSYSELDDLTVAIIAIHTLFSPPTFQELDALFLEVNQKSDLQIVYIHWGEEYEPQHSKEQEGFANTLVQLGVDMIVGHHPHVVQDIQLMQGVPVFYSLGNYVFDQYFNESVQQGLVLAMNRGLRSVEIDLQPVSTIGSVTQPRAITGREQKEFLEALADLSDQALKTQILEGKLVLPFVLASS